MMFELVFLVLSFVHVNGQWLLTLHFADSDDLSQVGVSGFVQLNFCSCFCVEMVLVRYAKCIIVPCWQRAIQDVLSLSWALTSASCPPPGGNCVIACPMLACSLTYSFVSQVPFPNLIQTLTR